MKIVLGGDHKGFALKERMKAFLMQEGYAVEDIGAESLLPDDDYTTYAHRVAERVSSDPEKKGIVMCGSGIGVDIVANKTDGVRCGLGSSVEQITSARKDDDINVLALAASFTSDDLAKDMIRSFLTTEYAHTPRYDKRLDDIEEIEKTN